MGIDNAGIEDTGGGVSFGIVRHVAVSVVGRLRGVLLKSVMAW